MYVATHPEYYLSTVILSTTDFVIVVVVVVFLVLLYNQDAPEVIPKPFRDVKLQFSLKQVTKD